MELTRLKALIDLVSQSKVAELEITEGGERTRIVKSSRLELTSAASGGSSPKAFVRCLPADQPRAEQPAETPPGIHAIASPMFGIIHRARSPEARPYVEPGTQVRVGDPLCLIEAMKTFNVVASDRNGTVTAILVKNGQEVEPGQPLFQIGQ
jgi:acetyl-CoA carboxylase biotin carboxyl carrier protein